jgi:hypothetical protein
MRHPNVFTPQVVVNGKVDGVGALPAEFAALVRKGDRGLGGPELSVSGGVVSIGAGKAPAKGAEVWLVRYDPREQDVTVRSGDNRGQTIVHKNVVREVKRLGAWKGRPTAYRLPAADEDGLKTVVLVQARNGGRILAVGQPRS